MILLSLGQLALLGRAASGPYGPVGVLLVPALVAFGVAWLSRSPRGGRPGEPGGGGLSRPGKVALHLSPFFLAGAAILAGWTGGHRASSLLILALGLAAVLARSTYRSALANELRDLADHLWAAERRGPSGDGTT